MDVDRVLRMVWESGHAIPDKWEDLYGPYSGSIELPHSINWSPGSHVYDMSDYGDAQAAYAAVLSEGGKEDVCMFVNGDRLLEMWNFIPLAREIRRDWESRFPLHFAKAVG